MLGPQRLATIFPRNVAGRASGPLGHTIARSLTNYLVHHRCFPQTSLHRFIRNAWNDGLGVARTSHDGGWAGRVAGCHRRHGRQLSVKWGGACPVELGQQGSYLRSRSDSAEQWSTNREPCWGRENGLCVRIAWSGRIGMPASVWRSRSHMGFQPAVAWEQRPTGGPATPPWAVSTPAHRMRNEPLLGLGESERVLGKAD